MKGELTRRQAEEARRAALFERLTEGERDSLCLYVDGRRAAGVGYEVIAEEVGGYAVGKGAKLSEEGLDHLEWLHGRWKQGQVYVERQRAAGDERGGTGGVAEVALGEVAEGRLVAGGGGAAASLFERAQGLQVVMSLKKALLRARWRWRCYRTLALGPGVVWRQCRGAGSLALPDGSEVVWLWGAVVVEREGGGVEVFPECRKRKVRAAGWNRRAHPALVVERRELDGEGIDLRDVSAALAVALHTCLGGEHSPFRNNEHLAGLLGVSREAIRMRKKGFIKKAGLRCVEGLEPNRAAGGRATQAGRRAGMGATNGTNEHE